MLLFLVTPYLSVAVQPCMEWIPNLKKSLTHMRNRSPNSEHHPVQLFVFNCEVNFLIIWIGYLQCHKTLIWIRDLDARPCQRLQKYLGKLLKLVRWLNFLYNVEQLWYTGTSGKKPDWHLWSHYINLLYLLCLLLSPWMQARQFSMWDWSSIMEGSLPYQEITWYC